LVKINLKKRKKPNKPCWKCGNLMVQRGIYNVICYNCKHEEDWKNPETSVGYSFNRPKWLDPRKKKHE